MKSADHIILLFVLLLFSRTSCFSQERQVCPVTAGGATVEIYYAADSSSGLKKSDFRNASVQPFSCLDSLTRGSIDAILSEWKESRPADSICFSLFNRHYSYQSVIRRTPYIPVRISVRYQSGQDVLQTQYFLNTPGKQSFPDKRIDRSYFDGALVAYTETSCLATSPAEEHYCYFSKGGLDSAYMLFNGNKTGFEYRFNGIGEEAYCHSEGKRTDILLKGEHFDRVDAFFANPCTLRAFYWLYPILKQEQQLPIRTSSMLYLFVQHEQRELQQQELNPK